MTTRSIVTIPKDKLSEMPLVTYSGTITIVDTPEQADAALETIFKSSVVGFDTETRPAFRKGHSNNVALMQVSNGLQCWLFRVNKLGVDGAVKRFLENDSILKVGLSIKDDFFVMHRSAEFEPKGFIDLQAFVKEYLIADASLQRIYAILFGGRISKGQRLSNWEADELTPAQQHYASIDAWACLRIYNHLKSGEFDPMSSPYLTEITEENE
jgi:ribonuclease D